MNPRRYRSHPAPGHRALKKAPPYRRPDSASACFSPLFRLYISFCPPCPPRSASLLSLPHKSSFPLDRYSPQISASLPHATMRCHSVYSCFSPSLFVRPSVVAIVKFATAWPLVVYLISGSRPKLPINITLFTPRIIISLYILYILV